MAKYLLPCACGKSTPVDLAQAGETITCDCGAQMAAPTMRGLKALPAVPDPAPTGLAPVRRAGGREPAPGENNSGPGRARRAPGQSRWGSGRTHWGPGQSRWGPGQGLIFLGGAVLLAGLSTLVYFYATTPTLDLDRLPGQFATLSPRETWRQWRMFEHGLPGPPTLETVSIARDARRRQQIFTTGCVVAILGAALAGIGVSYILAFQPRRGRAS